MKSAIKFLCGSLCLATAMAAYPAMAETELETKASSFKSKMEEGTQPTLDDMAEAQNVLAGLQLVLEIEKIQGEIDQVRKDREKASQDAMMGFGNGMAGVGFEQPSVAAPTFGDAPVIPQISAPIAPVVAPMPVATPLTQEPVYQASAEPELTYADEEVDYGEAEIEEIERPEVTVLKVLGSGGNFRARVQDLNGDVFDVYPGDDLEGAEILSISTNGVRVDLGTKKVTLPLDLSAATRSSLEADF